VLCEHLHLRLEVEFLPAMIGSPFKQITVVSDVEEGK